MSGRAERFTPVAAAVKVPNRVLFVDSRSSLFMVLIGCRGATAAAFAMNEDFARTLENQMDVFNSPDGDQVRNI